MNKIQDFMGKINLFFGLYLLAHGQVLPMGTSRSSSKKYKEKQ